eukprot:6341823-Amphidinium_carterae.1
MRTPRAQLTSRDMSRTGAAPVTSAGHGLILGTAAASLIHDDQKLLLLRRRQQLVLQTKDWKPCTMECGPVHGGKFSHCHGGVNNE